MALAKFYEDNIEQCYENLYYMSRNPQVDADNRRVEKMEKSIHYGQIKNEYQMFINKLNEDLICNTSLKDKINNDEKLKNKIDFANNIASSQAFGDIEILIEDNLEENINSRDYREIVSYAYKLLFKILFLLVVKNNRYDLKDINKFELLEDQKGLIDYNYKGHYRVIGPSGTGKTLVLIKRALRLAKENPKKSIRVFTINESLRRNIEEICESATNRDMPKNLNCHSFYKFFREDLFKILNIDPEKYGFADKVGLDQLNKNQEAYVETIEDGIRRRNTYESWDEFLKNRNINLNYYPAKIWIDKYGLQKINSDLEKIENDEIDRVYKDNNEKLYKLWLYAVKSEWKEMENIIWKDFLELTDNLEYFSFEELIYENLQQKLEYPVYIEKYLQEEIDYLRSFVNYSDYINVKSRTGRKYSLDKLQRIMMVYLAEDWHYWLESGGIADELKIAKVLLNNLNNENIQKIKNQIKTDYVLIDEVQDVSTTYIKIILSIINDPNAKNALFFTGDLQQKIKFNYLKFSNVGLNFQGRSYSLKKNYRNTRCILESAKKLVDIYKIPKDEEFEIIEPEFSNFEGVKPISIDIKKITQKVNNISHKDIICENIKVRLDMLNSIAVISENDKLLNDISEELNRSNIKHKIIQPNQREYINVGDVNNVKVFLSNMDSAKGYEFDCVILADISENSFKTRAQNDEEIWRDAAKLYVAMTRARDELIFTYEGKPHFFLEDIKDTLKSL
jgi:superfamily I DNA/RNA helicase